MIRHTVYNQYRVLHLTLYINVMMDLWIFESSLVFVTYFVFNFLAILDISFANKFH